MTNENNVDNRTETARRIDAKLANLVTENGWLNSVSSEEQRAERKTLSGLLAEVMTDSLVKEFEQDYAAAIYQFGLNRIRSGESAVKVCEQFVPVEDRPEFHNVVAKLHEHDTALQNRHNRDVRSKDDLLLSILAGEVEREAIRNTVAAARGMATADSRTRDNESVNFENRLRGEIKQQSGWFDIQSARSTARKLSRSASIGLSVFAQLTK